MAELRKLAIHCNFGTHLEDALRDRLVCGLKPALQGVQKKLLCMKELKLKKALAEALSHEAIEGKLKEMCDQQLPLPPAPIEKVSDHPKSTKSGGQQKGGGCFRCGRKGHLSQSCQFKELKCHRCSKKGHIAAVCRSSVPTNVNRQPLKGKLQEIQDGRNLRG